MDFTAPVSVDAHFEDIISDRQRLDNFKLGKSLPSNVAQHTRKPSHSRSRSRNMSVSVSLSTLNSPSMEPIPVSPPPSPLASIQQPNPNTAKRNSHHRRRSSVSTRRESAEMMGVSIPALPSDENVNLGDKDSIRRRALWALEGKGDVGAFSKVEIPELRTPDIEKNFLFPSKPSYPPGIGAGYGGGLSSLSTNKRDSFGKFMSSTSSKEQLGTLVEEEEEEEEHEGQHEEPVLQSPVQGENSSSLEDVEISAQATEAEPAVAPVRRRPASLNLRPLSLVSNTFTQAANDEVSTRPRPPLRSLTLATPPSSDGVNAHPTSAARKRQSLALARPSLTSPVEGAGFSVRRSSISYFSSVDVNGLPTPEMTPTSDKRLSEGSVSSDASRSSRGSRPLSTSEHHFLMQAHTALVQRISDLERALAARPHPHQLSFASGTSTRNDAPSEEMFQLITDLKAERDELRRDVDGWRTRVSDSQRQISLLMTRVEAERRDAWVARQRVELIEAEKSALERTLADKLPWGEEGWVKYEAAKAEISGLHEECQRLRIELQKRERFESECSELSTMLLQEKQRREEVERELESLLETPTPHKFDSSFSTPPVSRTMIIAKRGGLGFRSIDSADTFTEPFDDTLDRNDIPLKSVEEEDEEQIHMEARSDCTSEDELSRYEDEDENDYQLQAAMSSDSINELPRDSSHLLESDDTPSLITSRSNSSSPSSAPSSPKGQSSHFRHASLSAWTFPQTKQALANQGPEEIDRFFGCLEDVDNSPPLENRLRSAESGKNIFSRALTGAAADDDDFPPFFIPSDIGVVVPSDSKTTLDVVLEEEEEENAGADDEFHGEVDEGGIVFTFTPPPSSYEPEPEPNAQAPPPISQVVISSPPRPRGVSSSPSAIPRLASAKLSSSSTTAPSKPFSPTLSTPPPKRATSSSVPQPRSQSESPPTSRPAIRAKPVSFIPQPRRGATTSGSPKAFPSVATPTKASTSQPPLSMSSDVDLVDSSSYQEMISYPATSSTNLDNPHPDVVTPPSSSPIFSPSLAARISFQTLSNLIPVPSFWSSSNATSCSIPSESTLSSLSMEGQFGRPTTVYNVVPAGQPRAAAERKERGYVTKEQQLQKLRLRLEEESRLRALGQLDRPQPRGYWNGVLDI